MRDAQPYLPGRAPIDAYGNGGFRFADMSHRGSLLIVPSGVYAWDVTDFDALIANPRASSLARFLDELKPPAFVLLGTGLEHRMPPKPMADLFMAAGIALEPMATGAAARTYNVLLAEGRTFGAALIAVD